MSSLSVISSVQESNNVHESSLFESLPKTTHLVGEIATNALAGEERVVQTSLSKRQFSITHEHLKEEKSFRISIDPHFSDENFQDIIKAPSSLKDIPFRTSLRHQGGYKEYFLQIEMGLDVLPNPVYFNETVTTLENNKRKEVRRLRLEEHRNGDSRVYIENLYFPNFHIDRYFEQIEKITINQEKEIRELIHELAQEAKQIVLLNKMSPKHPFFLTLRRHLKGTYSEIKKLQDDAKDIIDFVVCYRHAKEKLKMLQALAEHFRDISRRIENFDSHSHHVQRHVRLSDLEVSLITRPAVCSVTSFTGALPHVLRRYVRGHILPIPCFSVKFYSHKPVAHLNPTNLPIYNSFIPFKTSEEELRYPLYAFLNRTEIVHESHEYLNTLVERELQRDYEKDFAKILLDKMEPSKLVYYFAKSAKEFLNKTEKGSALFKFAYIAGITSYENENLNN